MNSDSSDPSVQRSIDLEARFSWLERHVTEQDKVILELGDQVRALRREADEARRRLEDALDRESEPGSEPRPPHY